MDIFYPLIDAWLNSWTSSDLFFQGAGGAAFLLYNASTWRPIHTVTWCTVVLVGLEILALLVLGFGHIVGAKSIPYRGKHLDRLEGIDIGFVIFNKCMTTLFTYHLIQFICTSSEETIAVQSLLNYFAPPSSALTMDLPSEKNITSNISTNNNFESSECETSSMTGSACSSNQNENNQMGFYQYEVLSSVLLKDITAGNTIGALILLYVVYDFFYTLFHRALHHRSIYKYIHKHHHRQKAPSRGNVDAVNVHPFEFVCGEYNHLLALYLVSHVMQVQVHVLTILVFIVVGGFLASLNHTRFDLTTFASLGQIFPTISVGTTFDDKVDALKKHKKDKEIPSKNKTNKKDLGNSFETEGPGEAQVAEPERNASVEDELSSETSSYMDTKNTDVACWQFPTLYSVKYHDIHHWYPDSNYGQYIMLWDYLLGSFKPYPTTESKFSGNKIAS